MWFQTAITYAKKYWGFVALVVGVIAAVVIFRQREISFADEYKKIKDVHDEELKRIQDVRAKEQRQHEANIKQLQDTLEAVQKHYDDAKKDLDTKKKKEIEELVKQYKDDPDTLAKKLSEVTGFTVILP